MPVAIEGGGIGEGEDAGLISEPLHPQVLMASERPVDGSVVVSEPPAGHPDIVPDASLEPPGVVSDVAPSLSELAVAGTAAVASELPAVHTEVAPLGSAGFVSRVFFMWVDQLLALGVRKPLEVIDLPRIPARDTTEANFKKLKAAWDSQLPKVGRGSPGGRESRTESRQTGKRENGQPEKEPLLPKNGGGQNADEKGPEDMAGLKPAKGMAHKSLLTALFSAFWPQMLYTALLQLIYLVVVYTGPILLFLFVNYAAERRDPGTPYKGFVLVGALLLAKVVELMFGHQYEFECRRLGTNMGTACGAIIYSKVLMLSSSSRKGTTVGELVNNLSVDVGEVSGLVWYVHGLWSLPIMILVALVILYQQVGVSMFAGLFCMLIIMGLNLVVSKFIGDGFEGLMKAKDARMKSFSEALSAMKIIKLHSWEEKFSERVEKKRETEVSWLKWFLYWIVVNIFLLWLSPLLVSVATFAFCIYEGLPLTVARVFTSIATFRILQEPLRGFPMVVAGLVQAATSLNRLWTLLTAEELDPNTLERLPALPKEDSVDKSMVENGNLANGEVGVDDQGTMFAVEIENGEFSWADDDATPTLSEINVSVRPGVRVLVVGGVGSGKSSLLACILGEMHKVGGTVRVRGGLAYVAQSPFIQNGSIRDNILFGLPMDDSRYKEALRVACLDRDMAELPNGDLTVIGERGVNLSGGQKQRVQIARAVFMDADVYVLDDPLSAVDAHTSSDLFQECINGALANKTVIMVTHQIELLPSADLILVMRSGKIVQSGKYHDLLDAGTDLSTLVDAHQEAMGMVDSASNAASASRMAAAHADVAVGPLLHDGGKSPPQRMRSVHEHELLSRSGSIHLSDVVGAGVGVEGIEGVPLPTDTSPLTAAPVYAKLVQDEERETGKVDAQVYWNYFTKAYSGYHWILLIVVQIIWQGLQVGSDMWLAYGTESAPGPAAALRGNKEKPDGRTFIGVYAMLALGAAIFVLIRSLVICITGLEVTQRFFMGMQRSIFRAPMAFFDSTPSGRIMARVSKDQEQLDFEIPLEAGATLAQGFQLIGVFVVTAYVTPGIIIIMVPMVCLFVYIQRYYLASSRELTRLDGLTRSPIINHLSESLSGVATIRAFNRQPQFSQELVNRCDANAKCDIYLYGINSWLAIRLELNAAVMLTCVATLLILIPQELIKPGLVGLALSYGLSLSESLVNMMQYVCMLENEMISVERIRQFTDIPSEAPPVIEDHRPPRDWPQAGAIDMQALEVRYQPTAPPVLKGLSVSIKGGERVGIVGRTGSGKSTLIVTLFRLVEPTSGKIVIDGVDISSIGLRDLRSKLMIIPQEPTLFEGSVRTNLDPLEEYTDVAIWEALEKCNLAEIVKERPDKLESSMGENGGNWSAGQRQLFCLGRALLRRARILVLDEATASVDAFTDAIIQRTIRAHAAGCTVLSVAHRIPTVLDSDRIMTLDAGELKEFDSPANLMEDENSFFAKLVAEYQSRSSRTSIAADMAARASHSEKQSPTT